MNPAIGYAHFQLAGGGRAMLRWSVLFAILAFAALGVYARYGGSMQGALQQSAVPLLIITAILLVFVAGGRIGAALKLDASLDMARSHRLMPVSPSSAVLGYLIGPALPVLGVVCIAVLFATAGYAAGGDDLAALLVALGLIFTTALLLAMLNVTGGIGGKGGGIGWVWGVAVGAFFGTGGAIFAAVPWAAVLAAPASGRTVFFLQSVDDLTPGHAVGIAMHLAIARLLFAAACRRWQRPERPAFSTTLWLLLIALVVAGTLAGTFWQTDLRPLNVNSFVPRPGMTLPATLALLILLCHGPILAAEKQSLAFRLRRNVDDPAADEDRPKLPAWLAAVLAGALLVPLVLLRPAADPDDWDTLTLSVGVATESEASVDQLTAIATLHRTAWPITAACVMAALATAWALIQILTRLRASWGYFWIYLALWAVPVVAGASLGAWETATLERPLSGISAFGFPGALLVAWNNVDANPWPGVIFQATVALVLVIVALRVPDRAAEPGTREK